ncbi:MAG: DUF928 domain-containing protein [Spirulinaceae cyanobacterium]
MKSFLHLRKLPLLLAVILTMGSSLPALAYSPASESTTELNQSDLLLARLRFRRRGRYRVRGRRRPGARRGGCLAEDTKVTSLLPPDPEAQGQIAEDEEIPLTAEPITTVFFHVPSKSQDVNNPVMKASLLLKEIVAVDEKGKRQSKEIFFGYFELPEEPGIVGLKVPETEARAKLEPGKNYVWQVMVFCNPADTDLARNPHFSGLIKLDNSPEVADIKQQPLSQQAASFAEEGVWYSVLNSLAKLLDANPNSLAKADWQSILQEVEDGALAKPAVGIANQPFVGFGKMISEEDL